MLDVRTCSSAARDVLQRGGDSSHSGCGGKKRRMATGSCGGTAGAMRADRGLFEWPPGLGRLEYGASCLGIRIWYSTHTVDQLLLRC